MTEKREAEQDQEMDSTQNSKSTKSQVNIQKVEWSFRPSDQFKVCFPEGSMTMYTEDGKQITPTELFFTQDKVLGVLQALGINLKTDENKV